MTTAQRLAATYFEHYPGVMRFGDWIRFSEWGSCVITGRSDATLNRGGVRIGTAELYRVVEDLPGITDSLAVHLEDDEGGPGELILLVVTDDGRLDDERRRSIAAAVKAALSPRHVPDTIAAVPDIPRNLTGKKLELPVKKILLGADPASVVSRDAMANPASLPPIIELASARASSARAGERRSPMAEMDVARLKAIDTHVHVEQDACGRFALDAELLDASAKYFRSDDERTPTVEHLAAYYRARDMAAVIFTVDAGTGLGHPPLSSAEIAEQAAEHRGRPDPLRIRRSAGWTRGGGARPLTRTRLGRPGLQVPSQPPGLRAQRPRPLSALGGHRGAGRSRALPHRPDGHRRRPPGGRGIKLRYSDPMLLDDVAADFPGLTVILAHPSVPWQDSAISMATHKANVYIDLSGWLPKYFPPQLVRAINGLLKQKVLFGTDYPLISPERWIDSFEQLEIKPEVRPLVMKANAIEVLGLGAAAAG